MQEPFTFPYTHTYTHTQNTHMHVYVITVHFYVSLVVFVFKMRVYDSLGCHWRTRMRTVTPTCPVMSLDMTAALPALREQWKPTVASGPALPDSAVRPLWPRTPPGRRAGGGRVSPVGAVRVTISVRSEDHVSLLCGCFITQLALFFSSMI